MANFIIQLKDLSKKGFLLELLAQLDFIEVRDVPGESKTQEQAETYNFFQSAGLFSNREIDANQLRKAAWRIDR